MKQKMILDKMPAEWFATLLNIVGETFCEFVLTRPNHLANDETNDTVLSTLSRYPTIGAWMKAHADDGNIFEDIFLEDFQEIYDAIIPSLKDAPTLSSDEVETLVEETLEEIKKLSSQTVFQQYESTARRNLFLRNLLEEQYRQNSQKMQDILIHILSKICQEGEAERDITGYLQQEHDDTLLALYLALQQKHKLALWGDDLPALLGRVQAAVEQLNQSRQFTRRLFYHQKYQFNYLAQKIVIDDFLAKIIGPVEQMLAKQGVATILIDNNLISESLQLYQDQAPCFVDFTNYTEGWNVVAKLVYPSKCFQSHVFLLSKNGTPLLSLVLRRSDRDEDEIPQVEVLCLSEVSNRVSI